MEGNDKMEQNKIPVPRIVEKLIYVRMVGKAPDPESDWEMRFYYENIFTVPSKKALQTSPTNVDL